MNQIIAKKKDLLHVLHKNRDEHRDVFLSAQKNYRKLVIEKLDQKLQQARDGCPLHLQELIQITAPVDHTRDYNRIIGMLEMSVDEHVTLTEVEYRRFVEDNWEWSRDWAIANSAYTTSAKFAQFQEEES